MNKIYKDNLRKLGEFLIEDKARFIFDISIAYAYKKGVYLSPKEVKETHDDSIIADILGHAPLINSKYKNFDEEDEEFFWREYCLKYFDVRFSKENFIWCFSDRVKAFDNTRKGAGKRILWFCNHGLPMNYWYQLSGKAPLCYE